MAKIDPLTKAQGQKLAEFRKAAGFRSGRAAALEHDWKESTYRAHEAGKRTIGQDDAERYARAFRNLAGAKNNINAQAILFPKIVIVPGNHDLIPDLVRVPLISWVAAGRLADSSSQIPVEDVPLLAFADLGKGDFFALTVKGDSMDRLSPDGSIIIVDRSDTDLVPGKPFVFYEKTEGTTYKLWRPEPVPRLDPHSWNSANQPIFIKRKRDFGIIGRVRRTLLDL